MFRKRENYNAATTAGDVQPQITGFTADIDTAAWGSDLIDKGSATYNLSPGDLNRISWQNNHFGFRKTLNPGGGGKVYFLKRAPLITEFSKRSPTIGSGLGIPIPLTIIYLNSVANPLLDKNCVFTRTTACSPAGTYTDTYTITTPAQGGTCKTPSGIAITSSPFVVSSSLICSCPLGSTVTPATTSTSASCAQCPADGNVGVSTYWTAGNCTTSPVTAASTCGIGYQVTGITSTSAGSCTICPNSGTVGSSVYWTTKGACTTAAVPACAIGEQLTGVTTTYGGSCSACPVLTSGTSRYCTSGSCALTTLAPGYYWTTDSSSCTTALIGSGLAASCPSPTSTSTGGIRYQNTSGSTGTYQTNGYAAGCTSCSLTPTGQYWADASSCAKVLYGAAQVCSPAVDDGGTGTRYCRTLTSRGTVNTAGTGGCGAVVLGTGGSPVSITGVGTVPAIPYWINSTTCAIKKNQAGYCGAPGGGSDGLGPRLGPATGIPYANQGTYNTAGGFSCTDINFGVMY